LRKPDLKQFESPLKPARISPLEGDPEGRDVVDLIAGTTDSGKVSIKKRVKKYKLKRFRGEDEACV
jgi:hypothetical protein